jgi:hypothetical protein
MALLLGVAMEAATQAYRPASGPCMLYGRFGLVNSAVRHRTHAAQRSL